MSLAYDTAKKALQISGTTTLPGTSKGVIKGIFVSTTTAGTIKVWDSQSAAGTVLVNTFTPSAPGWIEFSEMYYSTGLTIQIANTIQCTVVYMPLDRNDI